MLERSKYSFPTTIIVVNIRCSGVIIPNVNNMDSYEWICKNGTMGSAPKGSESLESQTTAGS